MLSTARLRQATDRPLQGAVLALLLLAGGWMMGITEALGVQRPLAIPAALVVGLVAGRWVVTPMALLLLAQLVLIGVGLWSPLVPSLAAPFVRADVPSVAAVNMDAIDAVFVFSGGVNSRGLVSGEAVDRLLTGIALRARRPTLPLVVSNVRSGDRFTGRASHDDQQALIALVPAAGGAEWIDSVASTRDEAVRLSRRAFQARWRRVAVITSPMHSRRACATVEALGLPVTCVVAPWRPAAWPARTASDRMVILQRLTYETLAWAQYRVTGWAHW